MGRYVVASEMCARYNQTSHYGFARIESAFIFYAENRLDEELGPYFTVPFSSDNLTAKDLSLEYAYILTGEYKFEEREKLEKNWMSRIDKIVAGKSGMVVSSGSSIYALSGTIYSSTQEYHPTFGMGEPEDYHVDSSQVYDEYQDRS